MRYAFLLQQETQVTITCYFKYCDLLYYIFVETTQSTDGTRMISLATDEPDTIITLDPWDKLLILASAGLFLIFVLICIMCVLSPFCYLYQYCPFQTHHPVKGKSI